MTEERNAPESTLPIKRRRGRPRKDESLSHGESSSGLPISDRAKKNRHDKIDSTANDDNAFVGQMVSGKLDGSFDAGYLLTVKVGNTNTFMRGIVFDPRLSVPISAENDVAPHVKMFKRSEIPLPIPARPLSQAPPVTGRKEVSYELPTNLHECNVTILQPQESLRGMQIETNQAFPQASQPSSSQLKDKTKTAVTLSKGPPDSAEQAVRAGPQMAPTSKAGRRKSDHITKNGVILLPYYPVPSVAAQASPSEVKTQTKTEEPGLAVNVTIQADNKTTIQAELPNVAVAAAAEDTKIKAGTGPSVEICLGSEPGKELGSVMEQPPGVESHGFTPAVPDATSKVRPSTGLDCTLPPGAESHGFTPAIPDATLKVGPSTGLDCTLPPGVESHGFIPAIPDATLKVGPSTGLDCTLPPGVESHGFAPEIPDATLKFGPSTGPDCTLSPGDKSHSFTPAVPVAALKAGSSAGLDCTLPPGVQSYGFTTAIPDATLKVGPSTELDFALAPAAETFQLVSQSLETFLEKKVSPLVHSPLAGLQEVMQPKAKILEEGGHFSEGPSTGAVEVPIITDLHFDFMSNHPMGPYEAVEHELPDPTPSAFSPKDTI